MSDKSSEIDLIACRLSDLLSEVADAVREHASGGQYLASHMTGLSARVADLAAAVLPEETSDE